MFPSPYSPFFTSGLLSDGSPVPDPPPPPRRGSLPTDSPPTTQSSTDEPSAFYFMLQPRRDNVHYRSFLSLDLAESQSLRSASLKRKVPSATRKSDSILPSWSEQPPKAPLRVHTSRESLRTFPSRKPAPSSALPHVPSPDLPPRLPPIPFSAPLRLSSMHRACHSAPSVSTRRTNPNLHQPSSSFSPRPVSTSTSASSRSASTQQRSFSRSDALACLEGRSKSRKRIPRKRLQRNFMSMTDDDDNDDPETPPVPTPPPASKSPFIHLPREKEDVVVPSCFDLSLPTYLPPPAPLRHRPLTESWFPLASFMDVRDDDVSTWSWRSLIEVASMS